MMSNPTRIKIAALTTALALGGLTAAGLATRGGDEPSQPLTAAAASGASARGKPLVSRRRVKTVVAKPRAGTVATATGIPGQTGAASVEVPESDGEYEDESEDRDDYETEDDSELEEDGGGDD